MEIAGFTYYKNIMCVSSNYLTGNGYLTDTYKDIKAQKSDKCDKERKQGVIGTDKL